MISITLPRTYSDTFMALWASEVRASYPAATVTLADDFWITATNADGSHHRLIEEAIGWGFQIGRDAWQNEVAR